jgi:hypothetical protein
VDVDFTMFLKRIPFVLTAFGMLVLLAVGSCFSKVTYSAAGWTQWKNRILFLWLIICLPVLPGFYMVEAIPYYLDITKTYPTSAYPANYHGNGTTDPWNDVRIVNGITVGISAGKSSFNPGDVIYVKRGTEIKSPSASLRGSGYSGILTPRGSGDAITGPITIDAYGAGNNPLINAEGKDHTAAILLYNQDYWTIQNMQVTNDITHNAANQNYRWGIFVYFDGTGPLIRHGIRINKNNAYNIYGSYRKVTSAFPSMYEVGGINVVVEEPSKLDGVYIENNQVSNITGHGIRFRGEGIWGDNMDWGNLSTHVEVRGNRITDICDGILICGTRDVVVEHNIVDGAGGTGKMGVRTKVAGVDTWNETQASIAVGAIWPACSEGGVIQYNEVMNTKRLPGDGFAFDNDLANAGKLLIQYNYSHDNEGGFFMSCEYSDTTSALTFPARNPTSLSVVRYNVSQNDGNVAVGWNLPGTNYTAAEANACYTLIFHNFDLARNAKNNALIYNNTIYHHDSIRIAHASTASLLSFTNNIFSCGKFVYPINDTYNYNCYHGCLSPASDNHKQTNPSFVGSAGGGKDGLGSLQCYELRPGSPCINTGLVIPDNGGRSFWGAGLYNGKPDIGAYEVPTVIMK